VPSNPCVAVTETARTCSDPAQDEIASEAQRSVGSAAIYSAWAERERPANQCGLGEVRQIYSPQSHTATIGPEQRPLFLAEIGRRAGVPA